MPTWNYVTVHAYGPLVVRDEPDWVRDSVWELSDRHGYDSGRVDAGRIERMLRAIVGIEMPISRVGAKAKLNQNRSPDDVAGVIDGLRGVGAKALASEMEAVSLPHAEARFALIEDIRSGRRPGEADARPRD